LSGAAAVDGYGLLRDGLEQLAEFHAEFVLGEEDVPSDAHTIDLVSLAGSESGVRFAASATVRSSDTLTAMGITSFWVVGW